MKLTVKQKAFADFYIELGNATESYIKAGYKASERKVAEVEGCKLLKNPKIDNYKTDEQYNMRPYIDNEYHDYKEFIYQVKKDVYKKYVESCWGAWIEEDQRKYFENFINQVKDDAWVIQLNGVDIGFYNGEVLENGDYEIGNICIIQEYQGRGIGTKIIEDIINQNKDKKIKLQYFKQNPVGKLYQRLGFVLVGETKYHYQMEKRKIK